MWEWLAVASRRDVVRRALVVAAVVGTILITINHADALLQGEVSVKRIWQMGLTYLGALPLQRAIREQSDAGTPPVAFDPNSEVSGLYKALARQAAVAVGRLAKDYAAKFPTIKISKET